MKITDKMRIDQLAKTNKSTGYVRIWWDRDAMRWVSGEAMSRHKTMRQAIDASIRRGDMR